MVTASIASSWTPVSAPTPRIHPVSKADQRGALGRAVSKDLLQYRADGFRRRRSALHLAGRASSCCVVGSETAWGSGTFWVSVKRLD